MNIRILNEFIIRAWFFFNCMHFITEIIVEM